MPGMAQPLHGPNRLHHNKKDVQPWQERHAAEDMHNTLMSSQTIALPPQNRQVFDSAVQVVGWMIPDS